MKNIVLIIMIFISVSSIAQSPQFAVVRPDGTTYICPTWDSAYNKAVDGDNIYLPGVSITNQIKINKSLFIFGAGHHPDSSSTTGRTIFNTELFIYKGASGGSIEGIQVGSITIFSADNKIQNFTLKRCNLNGVVFSNSDNPIFDSLPENIQITECIIKGSIYSVNGRGSKNILFLKNIITNQVSGLQYSTFKNNDFLFQTSFAGVIAGVSNSYFENNIFLQPDPTSNSGCNNSYINNLKFSYPNFSQPGYCNVPSFQSDNKEATEISDIFINYKGNLFDYTNDYHLKSSSKGRNAGTDGTDVGIYGTVQPTSEGWVPSNPHIYYKQVDANTTTDGKLRVKFKVRTNQ